MKKTRLAATVGGCLLLLAIGTVGLHVEAQIGNQQAVAKDSLPAQATSCDPSVPIRIEMIPLNQPEAGRVARFRVTTDSSLDPDLVRNSWVEYEMPEGSRRSPESLERLEIGRRSGRSRLELGVIIPDERRYEIRARYVVQLADGNTIAQTAVRWVDLGEEDPPDGMIGRIVDPDGTGIRVYQGVKVRN